MMTKAKVEKKSENNNVKIKVWKIINILVIMIAVVFLAVTYAKSGVNNSWYNANDPSGNIIYNEEVVDKVSKMMVEDTLLNVGIYAVLQVYFYILCLFKCKRTIYISILAVLIVMVTPIAASFDLFNAFFPLISSFIYLRILKLEEE